MANTLRDIIKDSIKDNFPPHREKWTKNEEEELINSLCFEISEFIKYQLEELLTINQRTKVHGIRIGTQCPICKKIYNEIGDMENPSTDIDRREVCEECGEKLNKLIN